MDEHARGVTVRGATTAPVHLDTAAGVATITLDSPANRNALSAVVRAELTAALDTATDDPPDRAGRGCANSRPSCAGSPAARSRWWPGSVDRQEPAGSDCWPPQTSSWPP